MKSLVTVALTVIVSNFFSLDALNLKIKYCSFFRFNIVFLFSQNLKVSIFFFLIIKIWCNF